MGTKSKDNDELLWFRFHGGRFLSDARVQTLSLEHFKIWVNTLAFGGKRRNVSWSVSETLWELRETEESVSLAFHIFVERKLLIKDKEKFYLAEWDKLQYKSDTSTERVKRFRKRFKNVSETAPENRVNKERITNVIPPLFTQKEKEPTSVGLKRKPLEKNEKSLSDGYHRITHSTLPGEWKEWVTKNYGWDERMVGDVWVKFFEYFDRKRGASAQRSDWFATWRNWCDKENLPRKRVQEPKKHGEIPPQDLFKSVDGMPIL